jgi:hypothetical protein
VLQVVRVASCSSSRPRSGGYSEPLSASSIAAVSRPPNSSCGSPGHIAERYVAGCRKHCDYETTHKTSKRSRTRSPRTALFVTVLSCAGEHTGRACGGMIFLAFSVASAYCLLGFAEITAFCLGANLKRHKLPWNEAGSWATTVIASTLLAMPTVGCVADGRIKKPLLLPS